MGTFDSLKLGLELDEIFGGSADIDRLRWIELEEFSSWSVTFSSSCSGTKVVNFLQIEKLNHQYFHVGREEHQI
jgi:hypothetical protein